MYQRIVLSFLILLLVGFSACGKKDVNRRGDIKLRGEKPVAVHGRKPGSKLQEGLASWYGNPYHGRKTANGERYDMWAKTAAHKTLPFGSVVKVVNKDNGKWVFVRVNDRGPFVRGRIIDLSRAAAREIDLEASGIAPVTLYLAEGEDGREMRRVETAGKEISSADGGYWTIQVGSFADPERARAMAASMKGWSDKVSIEVADGMNRVRVGRFETKSRAGELAENLADQNIPIWIVFIEK